MKRTIFKALLILSTACLGVAAGSWLAVSKRSADFLAAYPEGKQIASPAPQFPPASADEDSTSMLLGALKITDPLERSFRIYQTIGRIGPEQLKVLLQRADEIPGEYRDSLRRALFARWLQIDPAGAAQWVQPFVRSQWRSSWSDGLDKQLTEMWVASNPSAALAEFLKFPVSANGENLVASTVLKMTAGDHAAAIAELGQIADAPKREAALRAALPEWAKSEPAAAFARLDSIRDPQAWAETASEVLGHWMKKDADAGLAKADSVIAQLSIRDAKAVVEKVAEDGGKSAAAWALAQTGELRALAVTGVFHAWRRNRSAADQIAAIEWASNAGLLSDSNNVSNPYSTHNETLPALLALPPSPGRTELLSQILLTLPLNDAQRVMDAVTAEGRHNLVCGFAQGQAFKATTAEKMVEVISLVPSGGDAGIAASLVGNLLPERFATGAVAAIEQIADPVLRDRAFVAAIPTLNRQSPEKTEATLGLITDPMQRDSARAGIIRSAHYENPAKARSLLESSPLSAEWKEIIRLGWGE